MQINAGVKEDFFKATAYHEASAGTLGAKSIKSSTIATIDLIQVRRYTIVTAFRACADRRPWHFAVHFAQEVVEVDALNPILPRSLVDEFHVLDFNQLLCFYSEG